jgi:hypothetical protein
MTINKNEMDTITRTIVPNRMAIINQPIVAGFTEDLIIYALSKSKKDNRNTGNK